MVGIQRYFIFFFLLTAFIQAGAETESEKVFLWRKKMDELLQLYSDITPTLFSKDVRDMAIFKRDVAKIYRITKDLDQGSAHGVKAPDKDPALPYVTKMFRDDIIRAYQSLENGQVNYAKRVLKGSMAYCIACHTRNSQGNQFPLIEPFSGALKAAPWIERISFQSASRQYDAVLNSVAAQLKTPPSSSVSALDIEKAVKIALAIQVRVKQDASGAEKLAKEVLSSPAASQDLKKSAQMWIKDIADWKKDSQKPANDEAAFKKAKKLLGTVATEEELAPTLGADVRYLRASALLHDLLGKGVPKSMTDEALFLQGGSYDVMRDLGLWSLHEMYYFSCIEERPHSDLSQICFQRYKESVVSGYSGSSGVHVPPDVSVHLKRLKDLAAPLPAVPVKKK